MAADIPLILFRFHYAVRESSAVIRPRYVGGPRETDCDSPVICLLSISHVNTCQNSIKAQTRRPVLIIATWNLSHVRKLDLSLEIGMSSSLIESQLQL